MAVRLLPIRETIDIAYNQFCVFWATLKSPYNDWSPAHVAQGFTWRPGSVSFGTDDVGPYDLTIETDAQIPELEGFDYAVRVPFTVPEEGCIEFGTVVITQKLAIQCGEYDLYFLCSDMTDRKIVVLFNAPVFGTPRVLKSHRPPISEYAMNAQPA